MPIGIEGWIPLYRNIDSTYFLSNEYDTSPPFINFMTPITVPLPLPSPKTPVPSPKLVMTPE